MPCTCFCAADRNCREKTAKRTTLGHFINSYNWIFKIKEGKLKEIKMSPLENIPKLNEMREKNFKKNIYFSGKSSELPQWGEHKGETVIYIRKRPMPNDGPRMVLLERFLTWFYMVLHGFLPWRPNPAEPDGTRVILKSDNRRPQGTHWRGPLTYRKRMRFSCLLVCVKAFLNTPWIVPREISWWPQQSDKKAFLPIVIWVVHRRTRSYPTFAQPKHRGHSLT